MKEIRRRNDLPGYLAAERLTVGAELGVAKGAFSERILLCAPEVSRLYSIDAWADEKRGHGMAEYFGVLERLSRFGERSRILRSRFDAALDQFADEELDFCYADGYAHTGQEGGETLEQWWSKVRPGGLFGGHDYCPEKWPKTVDAVDRFRASHKDEIRGFHVTPADRYPSWFVRKKGPVVKRYDSGSRGMLLAEDEEVLRNCGSAGDKFAIGENPLRGRPFFFRADGMPVDLVDHYAGSGVFVVLNGPSVGEMFPPVSDGGDRFAPLKQPGILTFGVNNGGHDFRPDFWCSVDDPTRFMQSIWMDPRIRKFVPCHHFHKRADGGQWVRDCPNVLGFRRNGKFVAAKYLKESTINWGNHADYGGGRSVMLCVLRIVHLLGFRRVYLIGADFNMSDTRKYFFEEDRTEGAIKGNNNTYQILQGAFRSLLPYFKASGFEVFNCTPGSKLTAFPRMDLDEALLAEKDQLQLEASTLGMYAADEKPTAAPERKRTRVVKARPVEEEELPNERLRGRSSRKRKQQEALSAGSSFEKHLDA